MYMHIVTDHTPDQQKTHQRFYPTNGWLDDGWLAGWLDDGWMDGWMDGQMDRWADNHIFIFNTLLKCSAL